MKIKKEITFQKISKDCNKYFFDLSIEQKKKVQLEWSSLQSLLQKIENFNTFDLEPLFLPTFVRNHKLRDDNFLKNDQLEECFKNSTKFDGRFVLINEINQKSNQKK